MEDELQRRWQESARHQRNLGELAPCTQPSPAGQGLEEYNKSFSTTRSLWVNMTPPGSLPGFSHNARLLENGPTVK